MRYGMVPMVLVLLVSACSRPDAPLTGIADWSTLPNAYAKHFQFQIRNSERRVLVFGPGGGSDTIGIYVLQGRPVVSEVLVDTPLTRVAVVSTTHLPYFTALGAAEAVVGIAHVNSVRDPSMKERVRTGAAVEIARADGLDRERLIALAPQALFDYPFGRKAGQVNVVPNTIAVTEYLEDHPLGRAEWVRFFGFLMGRQERADSVFRAIDHRYRTVRDMRSALGEGPRVLFGSNWEKDWFAPPGNSYMATLIADAGGRYWFADSLADGNLPMALEQVLSVGGECDHFGVVIAESAAVDPLRMAGGDPRIARLEALRRGGFIGNSARSDLFGQALLEPEIVLRDLRCIFYPRTCAAHRPTYFFPVAQ